MLMTQPSINYNHHRFPPETIAHAVWLYVRFNLSLREVEEMLLERGIDVSQRPFGVGQTSLDLKLAATFGVGSHVLPMFGTWMKSR